MIKRYFTNFIKSVKVWFNTEPLIFIKNPNTLYSFIRFNNSYTIIYNGDDIIIKSKSYKYINTQHSIKNTNWMKKYIILIQGSGVLHFQNTNQEIRFRKTNNSNNLVLTKGMPIGILHLIKIQ